MLGAGPVRRVIHGSFAAFSVYIAGVGLTFFSQLLIVRLVTPDVYGVYAYVLAWMTVLAYFAALGFDVALLRFVPAYQAQHEWGLVRGVIQYAERRSAAVGFVVVTTGIAAVALLNGEMSFEVEKTFCLGFFLVPALALLWIRCSTARAFGGVTWALLPDRIVRDGVFLGLVAVAGVLLNWKIDAPLVMMATVIGASVGLGFASWAVHRLRPDAICLADPVRDATTWRAAALPLVLMAAAETVMNRSGVLLLGWLGYANDAGIYSLAFNIAFLVTLPRTAVNTLFAPTISELFIRDDRETLQTLIARATVWTLGGAVAIAVFLAILAEPLMNWFGQDYVAGVPALVVLLVGHVIAAGAGSQLQIMTMTGQERYAAVLLILAAAANICASAVFIELFGLVGAAIATTMTIIGWNLAMGLFIRRRLCLTTGAVVAFSALFGPRLRRRVGSCNAVDMMDNASALPTCPQRQQQQQTAVQNWLKITHTTSR